MVLAWAMFKDRRIVERVASSERGRWFERFIPDEPGRPGEYTFNDNGEKVPLEMDAGPVTSGTLALWARELDGPPLVVSWREARQEIL
jgi:hypothetical protein